MLSYLIPTKQKSVKFPIHSNQAFYIAQSGIEYAVRYAGDQGWRGATDSGVYDLTRLNSPGVNQRNLGNGSFTISYDQSTNTLTSTGQITGSGENRAVRVSNFSPFLRLVFEPASATSTEPCWCNGTMRARFYIRNIRSTTITIRSFSATWTQTGAARRIQRIYMNGNLRFWGNYASGSPPVDLRVLFFPTPQTINSGQRIDIIVYWNNTVPNGADINFTFYTGNLGTGDSFKFNLDPTGNSLPNCGAGFGC
ncbi:MAG: hypothetical protein ACPL1G_04040 [Thermodesulfovibrionales bacterium]